jgi:very-short-patch-repair endonuclease
MGIGVARKLRQTSTTGEVKLWQYLRNRRFMGLKFRRQFPVGPYVVDFVCLSHKLVIELDGGQHMEQLDYDNQRTEYLEHFGFKVLRFWNTDVFCQFDALLEQMRLCIDS